MKNKEDVKANNKVRQSPFYRQSLTCYLDRYQCWGGIRCRWEWDGRLRCCRATGWEKKLIDTYLPVAKDLLDALHIKTTRTPAAAHLCHIIEQVVGTQGKAAKHWRQTYTHHRNEWIEIWKKLKRTDNAFEAHASSFYASSRLPELPCSFHLARSWWGLIEQRCLTDCSLLLTADPPVSCPWRPR